MKKNTRTIVEPTDDEIAKLAYSLFEEVGGRTATTLTTGSRQRPIYALTADPLTHPTSNRANIMDPRDPKCRENVRSLSEFSDLPVGASASST